MELPAHELIPKEVAVGIPVRTVTCGKEHTLLLTGYGSVYSLGAGSRAQLGLGNVDVDPVKSPRLIESLEGIIINQLSAGGWHSAAVSDGGDLYLWGWNESGQLGFPSKSVEHSPGRDDVSFLPTPTLLDIGEEEIKKVACGSRHTAALTEHNDVYTWGWNAYGQLGLGDTQTRDQPTQVQYFKDNGLVVEDIFCGGWNSGFVTRNTQKVP
ncbi:RCC1 domain-containing protein 1-like [Lineus longissimus]|uniref:RCC1 domain-containing protein 1-like n=1 Tax=Lineus longissimus TaxID=88925 RepID=UPI00315C7AC9